MNYSILNLAQISRINAILYVHYVTENGRDYKPPFRDGTARYLEGIGENGDILFLDEKLLEYAHDNFDYSNEVLTLLDVPVYSREDLVAMGKLPSDEL